MNVRDLRARVRAELAREANPANATAMQAYMKSAMPYLGVSATGLRRAEHREERYAAIELSGLRSAPPTPTRISKR